MIDYKKLIVYLCVGLAVALMIASCSASKKNVSVQKSHTDSSVIETKNNNHTSSIDSTGIKKGNKTYQKTTVIHFEPVEIDSDYFIVDTAPLIIKNKAGKQKIYLQKMTITETGSIAKTDSSRVIKKADSTASEQKKVNVVSDKKEVIKQKYKFGWNWWYLLALMLCLLSPKVRQWILNKIKLL